MTKDSQIKEPIQVEPAQSIDEYNADLEAGEAQIESGDFITSKELKDKIASWVDPFNSLTPLEYWIAFVELKKGKR